MTEDFAMRPASGGILLVLAFLAGLTLLLLVVLHDAPVWATLLALTILGAVAGIFALFFRSSRTTIFTLAPEGLTISGTMYGRFLSLAMLDLSRISLVNLEEHRELRPKWRTHGLGLPDYQLGWFMLASNEKALLFVTDRHEVVHIPTTLGFSLLLSPERPQEFVAALKSLAA